MENQRRYYEEFEPYCKWQKGQQEDVLEVHVQGFKKEQLKATMNSLGVLKITGELSLDEHRWIRFRKEINVSKDYKMDGIHIRFLDGIVRVTIPKRIPCDSTQADKPIQEDGDKKTYAVPRLEMSEETALKLGALLAVAAVGAYVAYKNLRA